MVPRVNSQETISNHFLSCMVVNITSDKDLCALFQSILVKSLTATPTNSHTANKRIIMVITNQANTVQTKNCFYFKSKFFNGLWRDITHSTDSMIFRSLR